MRLAHRLRRGASPFVDVGWALGQFAALVAELTIEAWTELRARDRRRVRRG